MAGGVRWHGRGLSRYKKVRRLFIILASYPPQVAAVMA